MLKMIFATGVNGEFGLNGSLPWGHNKDDLKNFQEYTKGARLVMGARTFESLPRRLPNRLNIVISSRAVRAGNGDTPDLILSSKDVSGLITSMARGEEDIVVIGGASLIELMSEHVDEMNHTVIDGDFDCDVRVDLKKVYEGVQDLQNEKISYYNWGNTLILNRGK